MDYTSYLPIDAAAATLLGRAHLPFHLSAGIGGPSPILVSNGLVYDLFQLAPTLSHLLNRSTLEMDLIASRGNPICTVEQLITNTLARDAVDVPYLLAPADLQAIKACGVTFACSMIERVIEERAAGDACKAVEMRDSITEIIGDDLSQIRPGSDEALRLKGMLLAQGMWSQYLEVGIGKNAEVFTKSQPMSAVGLGCEVGLNSISTWNNPEPELVLAVNCRGEILGATLGNDVNLRDVEGRSALLLGKAKDNNASCAIGPFIRLLDDSFTLDDLRQAEISLKINGPDGYVLEDQSRMAEISRDITELVAETWGSHHQYPDGFMLFTGTLFAPTADRGVKGSGFTHCLGDMVRISSPRFGCLENRVTTSDQAAPWTFGTGALFENIMARMTANSAE